VGVVRVSTDSLNLILDTVPPPEQKDNLFDYLKDNRGTHGEYKGKTLSREQFKQFNSYEVILDNIREIMGNNSLLRSGEGKKNTCIPSFFDSTGRIIKRPERQAPRPRIQEEQRKIYDENLKLKQKNRELEKQINRIKFDYDRELEEQINRIKFDYDRGNQVSKTICDQQKQGLRDACDQQKQGLRDACDKRKKELKELKDACDKRKKELKAEGNKLIEDYNKLVNKGNKLIKNKEITDQENNKLKTRVNDIRRKYENLESKYKDLKGQLNRINLPSSVSTPILEPENDVISMETERPDISSTETVYYDAASM